MLSNSFIYLCQTHLTVKKPEVGVAVLIKKEGKLLVGRRRKSWGYGTWQMPGGHLEFGESFEDCAKRETKEEAGVEISNIRFLTVTNDFFPDEKRHYITIWMVADWTGGRERNSSEGHSWKWLSWDEIRELKPLFLPVKNLIKQNTSLNWD